MKVAALGGVARGTLVPAKSDNASVRASLEFPEFSLAERQIVSEAARRIPPDLQATQNQVPWEQIVGIGLCEGLDARKAAVFGQLVDRVADDMAARFDVAVVRIDSLGGFQFLGRGVVEIPPRPCSVRLLSWGGGAVSHTPGA